MSVTVAVDTRVSVTVVVVIVGTHDFDVVETDDVETDVFDVDETDDFKVVVTNDVGTGYRHVQALDIRL